MSNQKLTSAFVRRILGLPVTELRLRSAVRAVPATESFSAISYGFSTFSWRGVEVPDVDAEGVADDSPFSREDWEVRLSYREVLR